MFVAWYVDHFKLVSQGLLFEVLMSGVTDTVQGSATENFERWSMVHCDGSVVTSKDKVTCFV